MDNTPIKELQPGLRMDLLLAEKLFGWIAWAEDRKDYTQIVFQRPGEQEPYKRMQKWEAAKERYRIIPFAEIDPFKHVVSRVPNFSTDISAAWEVTEKFYYVDIRKINKMDEDRRCKWAVWVSSGDGYSHNATADSAPEAICKAALLALNIKE